MKAPPSLPDWGQALLLLLLLLLLLAHNASAQAPSGTPLGSNGINTAVANAALPLGVSQILMAPGNAGSNKDDNGQLVPLYGASIAWSPTTTGRPRVAVGSCGAMNTVGVPGFSSQTVYGAVYVYTSEQFSFTLLQTLLPPSAVGSPGLQPFSWYGVTIAMSQNSVVSPVVSGTNMFVGQTFRTVQARSDETVYFYSATTQTTGLTRSNYVLRQSLRLTTSQSCNFGSTLALSPDDTTLIVGAPGMCLI